MSKQSSAERLQKARLLYPEKTANQRAAQADQEQSITFDQRFFVQATGTGNWPGTHAVDSISRIRGELGAPHLPYLPELKHRGFATSTLARTIATLEGLHADGTSFGWRITEGFSKESQLAETAFASDINALADVAGKETSAGGFFKIQFTGPVTLASQLHLDNGEKAASDYGARRDIRDSFLTGVKEWLRLLKEAVPGEHIVVQLNEPELDASLNGTIPTSSGYRTLRAVPRMEAEETLNLTVESLKSEVDQVILAENSANISLSLAQPFDGISLQPMGKPTTFWETIATHIEAERNVWLGVVDPLERRSISSLVNEIWSQWRTIGLSARQIQNITITETSGLDQLQPDVATGLLEHLTETVRALSETAQEN